MDMGFNGKSIRSGLGEMEWGDLDCCNYNLLIMIAVLWRPSSAGMVGNTLARKPYQWTDPPYRSSPFSSCLVVLVGTDRACY